MLESDLMWTHALICTGFETHGLYPTLDLYV